MKYTLRLKDLHIAKCFHIVKVNKAAILVAGDKGILRRSHSFAMGIKQILKKSALYRLYRKTDVIWGVRSRLTVEISDTS